MARKNECKKKPHIGKKKKTAKPVKLYTLDTETIGLDGEMRLLAIYDGETVTYGFSFEEIEPILLADAKKYSVHIYVHNLDFDIRKLKDFFKLHDIIWKDSLVIDNRYATLSTKYFVIHDSFKLLPQSLKSLSEGFNVKHGKLDLWDAVQKEYPNQYKNHVDFLARCPIDNHLYREYLAYDVMALYEIISELSHVAGLDLSELVKRPTTASLSKYLFKKGHKGIQFATKGAKYTDFEYLSICKSWDRLEMLKHSDTAITFKEIEDKMRLAYFGGRTEVFKPFFRPKKNGEKLYHYDVNSEYPYVMATNDFPIGYPEYYTTPKKIEKLFSRYCNLSEGLGFIRAQVYIPYQHIPPLPVKHRENKLFFPCGTVEGWFCFPELKYAVENCGCRIEKYHEIIFFKETYPIFKNFVEHFYKMKEEGKKMGNKALTTLAKLILNTAYGWTGMRREKTAYDNLENYDKHKDDFTAIHRDLGAVEYISHIKSQSIQVQIACTVTSYARLVLLEGLRGSDAKGDVYYCDTDSIVSRETLPDEIIDPYRIGAWDLEKVINGEAYFLFPKVYYETVENDSDTIKFKGVSKDTQKELTRAQYEKLYNALCGSEYDRVKVEENRPLMRSMVYAQKAGIDPNRLEYRDKSVNLRNKQKRIINYRENYTVPYFFEDLKAFRDFTFKTKKGKGKDGILFDMEGGEKQ